MDNLELTMYIFINNDLRMEKGKIASQVGHVVQHITEDIIRMGYESASLPDPYKRYMLWKNGSKKIVLKATEQQLLELMKLPESRYVIDAGKTQIAPNSLTVVGFFPSTNIKEIAKDYKLL